MASSIDRLVDYRLNIPEAVARGLYLWAPATAQGYLQFNGAEIYAQDLKHSIRLRREVCGLWMGAEEKMMLVFGSRISNVKSLIRL